MALDANPFLLTLEGSLVTDRLIPNVTFEAAPYAFRTTARLVKRHNAFARIARIVSAEHHFNTSKGNTTG